MTHALLHGQRVVESSAFVAAPLAGLTLAQHGADVIRVDLPGGGIDHARMPRMPARDGRRGRSLYWTSLNKGKRSVAIDLRRPEGRELLQALVTAPDDARSRGGLLLTNIGTPWLAHGLLARTRPDLISCTIEGHGDGGTAVDYTVHCATGYPYVTGGGSPERPVNQVLPAWDIACAYQAAFAMTAALLRRRQSGHGAELRLALSDVAFTMLSHLGVLPEAELLQQDRPSIGNHIYGAFGRDFATRDGRRVMVAGISANQWQSLVRACGLHRPLAELASRLGLDFDDEAQRHEARDAIAALFEPWFAARSFAEATAALDAERACWGPYRSAREALADDPRVSDANPVFERVAVPGVGTPLSAGAATRLAEEPRTPTPPAPWLGQHTDAVLMDVLRLPAAEVGRLHDAGIVAGPERDPTRPAA